MYLISAETMLVCISALFYLAVPIIILKVYWKLNTRWNGSYKCLVGKTALVTGANTGIGYYIALDFAKRGARVILACRNQIKAEEAQRKIIKMTGNDQVIVKVVDMESFESVRNFAKDFNETEDRLDILVNNAGILSLDYETKDGYPVVMQVNHLSPFLLTHLLIDKLKKSAPGRVVIVASNLVQFGNFELKNLGLRPKTSFRGRFDGQIYSDSKLCNALFCIELNRRLKDSKVIVNAVHPGAIHTNIFDNVIPIAYWGFVLFAWILKTIEEGAQTPLYAALSDDAGNTGGRFFNNCKDVGHYKNAKDPKLAREVWIKSEELVHLREEEKIKV